MDNLYFTQLCYNGAKPYRPKINRTRQIGLLSLMVGDIIIPMTFGVGFAVTKLITKFKPLFMYK